MKNIKKVALIGCGSIGSYVMEAAAAGKLPHLEIAVVCVRSNASKGVARARELGIPVVMDAKEILSYPVDIVAENASHQAVEAFGELFLKKGISLIPMSLGALVDGDLLERLVRAAEEGGSQLLIPSGGIGGLDAIAAGMVAGIEKVTMISRKPPVAWKHIPYVEEMGWDLDHMTEPTLLFEGPARDCVKKFPQNINIAAALSLASLGFDQTIIRIYADPTVVYNTHQILGEGTNGKFQFLFENTPIPENPKTTYQACTSVVATLARFAGSCRVGT